MLSENVTVLLVNSDAVVRRGLRRVLENDQDISIVGETEDGNNAVLMALELQPRVVIMDCLLSGVDGFGVARKIAQSCPRSAIVLSGVPSGKPRDRCATEVGAHASVSRTATAFDLVSHIKRMAAGERTLARPTETSRRRIARLSTRELQVLRMIVGGYSKNEIAFQLGLSVNTVSVHRTRIARSLGVRGTAELITYALSNGLAELPSAGYKEVTREVDPERVEGRHSAADPATRMRHFA